MSATYRKDKEMTSVVVPLELAEGHNIQELLELGLEKKETIEQLVKEKWEEKEREQWQPAKGALRGKSSHATDAASYAQYAQEWKHQQESARDMLEEQRNAFEQGYNDPRNLGKFGI